MNDKKDDSRRDVDNEADSDSEDLASRLNRETAVVAWSEMIKHFARGAVIHVTPEMDLIEAAVSIANDDSTAEQSWLQSGVVRRASDDDARDWTAREPNFWCVVIAPWVLIQERHPDSKAAMPRVVH